MEQTEKRKENKVRLGVDESTYRGMIVGISVINTHVLKVAFNVRVEESLYFSIIVLGIHKDSADVRLDDIRERLCVTISIKIRT